MCQTSEFCLTDRPRLPTADVGNVFWHFDHRLPLFNLYFNPNPLRRDMFRSKLGMLHKRKHMEYIGVVETAV